MRFNKIIIGFLVIIMLSGCISGPANHFYDEPNIQSDDILKEEVPSEPRQITLMPETGVEKSGIQKFDNISELREYLLKTSTSGHSNSYGGEIYYSKSATIAIDDADFEMVEESDAGRGVGSAPTAVAEGSAQDYSSTNVQYEAVDEGDFVKNDDRYIYMIADNKLIIVDAYDAKNAKIISETKLADDTLDLRGEEIFINKDKLVLFAEYEEPAYYFERYDIKPRRTYKQNTKIFVYDISDKDNISILKEFSITGNFYQARMIGDIIYSVTQEYINDITYVDQPAIRELSNVIKPEIYYFDNPEDSYQFNTVSSISLDSQEVIDSKTFMIGYSNTLMVSEKNIYIAYKKQRYWWARGEEYEQDRFYKVILPLMPQPFKQQITDIQAKDLTEQEKWESVSEVLVSFYQKVDMDEEKYEDLLEKMSDALIEYDSTKALDQEKTIIHKIAIDKGSMEYKAEGHINGQLLNQFSLDEYDGYLRLASTIDLWIGERIRYNNVYIFDENMDFAGGIENIAEDERIYSARFMGNRLYLVTFKQMDPFFVIDLSNPQKPKVLGELKIPGYSDYLHPYDENHIIGVGKETEENEWGGVSTKGVKVALFDVSNVKDPKLVDKVEIGDQGSDSPALHDHHAFLFSKEKNLLVLPVTEVTKREKIDKYLFNNYIWHGAYVFNVDKQGFKEIGKVKHDSSRDDYFRWWNEAAVLRSLYMDNNLYTISNKYIKINNLENGLEELNTVNLPYSSKYYWR